MNQNFTKLARRIKSDIGCGQLINNLNHEIRTPLSSIMGFIDLLAEDNLTAQQCEYTEIIRYSADNLMALIDEILTFIMIETHTIDLEIKNEPLAEILDDIDSTCQPLAQKKNIEFRIIPSDSLPSQIHTNAEQLQQCLAKLTLNALKFTQNGYVKIYINSEEKQNLRQIRFDIEDTGIGIHPDKQKEIFRPFIQVDSSTTRIFGGIGLSLTIAQKLANLLDGDISLKSKPDIGSTFTLRIPAHQP